MNNEIMDAVLLIERVIEKELLKDEPDLHYIDVLEEAQDNLEAQIENY